MGIAFPGETPEYRAARDPRTRDRLGGAAQLLVTTPASVVNEIYLLCEDEARYIVLADEFRAGTDR